MQEFYISTNKKNNASKCEEVEEEGKKSRHRGKVGGTNQCKSSSRKYNSSWEEEEQLVDYEPEEPAAFSPVEEDNYSDGDDYSAHRDGPEDNIDNTD